MSRKLKVLLCQLPYPFQLKGMDIRVDNVPLAAGYLKSMAYKEGLLKDIDIEILDYIDSDLGGDARLINAIIMKAPDILGFSLYPWNTLRSLYFAEQIKKVLPKTQIIVGGPEVTLESELVLSSTEVDIGVFGEGELIFSQILRHFIDGKPELYDIRGIYYRRGNRAIINPLAEPINDINQIPSPYLLGFIDPSNYGAMWIEISRWCPFRCKYCIYHKRFMGRKPFFSLERIQKEMELAKSKGIKEICFLYDSAFNLLPEFENICRIIKKINKDKTLRFAVMLYAERLNKKIVDLLEDCNVKNAEVGLQSIDAQVIRNVNRPRNDLPKFLRGANLLKKKQIRLVVDIILGLPGETLKSFKKSLDFLKDNELLFQMTLSILSVGPGTDLRKEADKFGLKFQPYPPHLTLGTHTLPHQDFRKALKLVKTNLRVGENDFYPFCKHATMFLDRNLIQQNKLETVKIVSGTTFESSASGYPVNKIILDIDSDLQSPQQLKKLGEGLSNQISNTLTVWLRLKNPEEDIKLTKAFLSAVSIVNPFVIWNVLVESKQLLSPPMIDEIQNSISYTKNMAGLESWRLFFSRQSLDGYKAEPPRIFILTPFEHSLKKSQLDRITEKAFIFWLVEFSGNNGQAGRLVENIRRIKYGNGFFIDFSNGTSPEFILEALELLETKNTGRKIILFKDLVLKLFWDMVFRREYVDLKRMEHIVKFDCSLKFDSLAFQEKDILQNIFDWYAMLKLYRKNLDLNRIKSREEIK